MTDGLLVKAINDLWDEHCSIEKNELEARLLKILCDKGPKSMWELEQSPYKFKHATLHGATGLIKRLKKEGVISVKEKRLGPKKIKKVIYLAPEEGLMKAIAWYGKEIDLRKIEEYYGDIVNIDHLKSMKAFWGTMDSEMVKLSAKVTLVSRGDYSTAVFDSLALAPHLIKNNPGLKPEAIIQVTTSLLDTDFGKVFTAALKNLSSEIDGLIGSVKQKKKS